MDLKKLFSNNKAVSPVIGVVLMVAITVILAAAIGSSVFGQGPAKSAPQANIDIIVVDSDTIKLEHLGGDTVILNPASTQIVFARGDQSFELDMSSFGTHETGGKIDTYSTLDVGMTKTLNLKVDDNTETLVALGTDMSPATMSAGEFATVKIVDVKTKQLIADKELRF